MLCCDNLHKKAIGDFNLHSYFIAIKVTNERDTINVVIENAILYSILNENNNLTQKEYKKKIYSTIEQDKPLSISKSSFMELKSYELIKDKEIEDLNRKGTEVLINAFFKDGIQYKDLTEIKLRHLIYCLFNEKRIVRTDDESGLLYIYTHN